MLGLRQGSRVQKRNDDLVEIPQLLRFISSTSLTRFQALLEKSTSHFLLLLLLLYETHQQEVLWGRGKHKHKTRLDQVT